MTRAEALALAAAPTTGSRRSLAHRRSRRWCGVMDYGKFLFEQNKKSHSAKRKQKQIHVKEVKFRPVRKRPITRSNCVI